MFIKQAQIAGNQFYKYLLGFIIIAIGFAVGQLPLTGYVMYLAQKNGIAMPTTEMEMAAMMNSSLFLFLVLLSFFAVAK